MFYTPEYDSIIRFEAVIAGPISVLAACVEPVTVEVEELFVGLAGIKMVAKIGPLSIPPADIDGASSPEDVAFADNT